MKRQEIRIQLLIRVQLRIQTMRNDQRSVHEEQERKLW